MARSRMKTLRPAAGRGDSSYDVVAALDVGVDPVAFSRPARPGGW
jgi:hypothetical protein